MSDTRRIDAMMAGRLDRHVYYEARLLYERGRWHPKVYLSEQERTSGFCTKLWESPHAYRSHRLALRKATRMARRHRAGKRIGDRQDTVHLFDVTPTAADLIQNAAANAAGSVDRTQTSAHRQ